MELLDGWCLGKSFGLSGKSMGLAHAGFNALVFGVLVIGHFLCKFGRKVFRLVFQYELDVR